MKIVSLAPSAALFAWLLATALPAQTTVKTGTGLDTITTLTFNTNYSATGITQFNAFNYSDFFGTTWDTSKPFSFGTTGLFGEKYGASGTIYTNGKVGFDVTFGTTAGTVDIAMPNNISLTYPDLSLASTAAPIISIAQSRPTPAGGNVIASTFPQPYFSLDATFKIDGRVDATYDYGVGSSTGTVTLNDAAKFAAVATSNPLLFAVLATTNPFDNHITLLDYNTDGQGKLKANGTTLLDFTQDLVIPLNKEETLIKGTLFLGENIGGLESTINYGNLTVSPVDQLDLRSGANYSKSVTDVVFRADVDPLGLAAAVAGWPINPFRPQLSIGGTGISLDVNLFTTTLGVDVGLKQTLSLAPRTYVNLKSNFPVKYSIPGVNGGAPFYSTDLVYMLPNDGSPANITIVEKPTDPTWTLFPSLFVAPQLSNNLALNLSASAQLTVASLTLETPFFTVGTGPAFSATYSQPIADFSLFSQTLDLSTNPGFQTIYRTLRPLNGGAIPTNFLVTGYTYEDELAGSYAAQPITGRLILTRSSFDNTTLLSIPGSVYLKGASNVAGSVGLSVTGTLAIDGGSKFTVDATSPHSFINSSGLLATGNYELGGRLEYTGTDLATIGADATVSLVDNATYSGPHFVNFSGTEHDALRSLSRIEGKLTLDGANLTTDQYLSLASTGQLTLLSGSDLTAAGYSQASGAKLGLSGNSILTTTASNGAFGNVDSNGVLSDFTAVLGDTIGGKLIYSGQSIVTNAGNVTLSGTSPTVGHLVLDTSGLLTNALSTLTSNTGTLSLAHSATQTLASGLTNTGTLSVASAAALTINGALTNNATFSAQKGVAIDVGTINATSYTQASAAGLQLTNGGTLALSGTPGNLAGGVLSGGSWLLGGTLRYGGTSGAGTLLTGIGADTTVRISGTGSGFALTDTTNATRALATNAGTLSFLSGASASTDTAFSNSGTLTVSGLSPLLAPTTFSPRGLATNPGTITVAAGGILDTTGGLTTTANAATTYWNAQPATASSLPLTTTTNLLTGGGSLTVEGNLRYTGPLLGGVAAGTTLAISRPTPGLSLLDSTYTFGGALTRVATDGSTSNGFAGISSIAGTFLLGGFNNSSGTFVTSGPSSARIDSSLNLTSTGKLTLGASSVLQLTGAAFTLDPGATFSFANAHLILGGGASATRFTVPTGTNFTGGSISLGRVTVGSVGAIPVYDTVGTGELFGAGTWTNVSGSIRGAGRIFGAAPVNRGSILSADGTLTIDSLTGTMVNSGTLGSAGNSLSSSTLVLSGITLTNFENIGGSVKPGIIDATSHVEINNSVINYGVVSIPARGNLSVLGSTLNVDNLSVVGTLTVQPGNATTMTGGLKIEPGGTLTLTGTGSAATSAALVVGTGSAFVNAGTINLQSGSVLSGAPLENSGLLNLSGGRTITLGNIDNKQIGRITLDHQSTLEFSSSTVTNAGRVFLSTDLATTGSTSTVSLQNDTTLTGGGSIQLGGYNTTVASTTTGGDPITKAITNWVDGSGNAIGSGTITGQTGNEKLTIANQTIVGQGNIGNDRLSILNSATGLIQVPGNGSILTINPNADGFRNLGTLDIGTGAKLVITDHFTSFGNSTLTEGRYRIAGTLVIPGVTAFDNAANIVFGSATARITNESDVLATVRNNLAGGIIEVRDGASYAWATTDTAPFTNSGTLLVNTGGSLSITGGYFTNFNSATSTLTGGTLAVDSSSLMFTGAHIVTNAAGVTLGGTAPLIVDQNGLNALRDLAANTGTLTINDAANYTLPSTAAALRNSGILAVTGNATLTVANSTFYNTSATGTPGTVRVAAGSTLNLSALDGFSGTMEIAGKLKATTSTLTALASNLALVSPTASVVDASNASLLTPLATITSTGQLTVAGGASTTLPSTTFTNNGTILVGSAAAPNGDGSTVSGAGTLTIMSSTPTGTGTITLASPGVTRSQLTFGLGGNLTTTVTGNGNVTGILQVGSGGAFNANAASGSSLSFSSAITLAGGRLDAAAGNGLIFNNGFRFDSGIIDLTGNLASSAFTMTAVPVNSRLTLRAGSSITNLTGGSALYNLTENRGTFEVYPNGIRTVGYGFTNTGTMLVDGGTLSGTIVSQTVGENVLTSIGAFVNSGSLSLLSSANLINFSAIENSGALFVSGNGLSTPITGAGSVNVTGTPLSTLPASPDRVGPTNIDGGKLAVSADAQLGATIALTTVKNGGTLTVTQPNAVSTARAIDFINGATIGANDSSVTPSTVTLGTVSGSGALALNGATPLAINSLLHSSGTLQISGAVTLHGATLGGALSGAGTLTLDGTTSAITTLTADSTLVNLVLSGAADFRVGTGGSLSSGAIANNASLTFNRSGATTANILLSGTGAFNLAGGVDLTLPTNSSSFAGTTTIGSTSTLRLGTGGTIGSLGGTVVNNGTLSVNIGNTAVFANPYSGTGTLQQDAAGHTLILTGTGAFSSLKVNAGTLQIGNDTAFTGTVGSIVNNSALVFQPSNAISITGAISGTGQLSLNNATGSVHLANNSTYTGVTTVTAGTLTIGADSALGAAPATFTAGQLVLAGGTLAADATFSLAATRGVTLLTDATVDVAANQTFTIPTSPARIGAGSETLIKTGTGTLSVGWASPLPAYNVQSGTLVLDSGTGSTFAFGGTISGAGNLTFAGTTQVSLVNPLTLTGTTTIGSTGNVLYLGSTLPFAGPLSLDGSLTLAPASGNIALGTGVTGHGTIVAAGTNTSVVTLDPASTFSGTIAVQSSEFSSSALPNKLNVRFDGGTFRFAGDNRANTQNGLAVTTSGTLSLTAGAYLRAGLGLSGTGSLNVTSPGAAGTLEIWTPASTPNAANSVALTLNGATAFHPKLILGGNPAVATSSTWNGVIDGLFADLEIGTKHAATLTANNPLIGGTITVRTDGTLILGNGGTTGSVLGAIATESGAAVAYNHSGTYTVPNTITGAGGLTQSSTGTLILDTDAAFTGTTTIAQGTLQLGTNNAGTTGSVAGPIVNNGTLTVNRFTDLSLASISGTGALTKLTSTTLTLTGATSYTGATDLQAGTLKFLQSHTGTGNFAVASGASLTLAATGTPTFAGTLSGTGTVGLTGTGGTITTFTNASSFAGNISGVTGAGLTLASNTSGEFSGVLTLSGNLLKTGTGTTILSGQNVFTGTTTTLERGTLQIGNGGATGRLDGNIVLGDATHLSTALIFNRGSDASSGAFGPSGIISGTGSVEQRGAYPVTFVADHTYTGGTTIATGSTLQLGSGGTTGSFVGNVINNGTITFNHSNALSFDGVATGTGKFSQLGSGTLTLTGNNTATGGATIAANTTLALATTASLAGPVLNSGTLSIATTSSAGAREMPVTVTGSGNVAITGGGTLRITGGVSYTGNTTLAGNSTLSLSNTGTSTLAQPITGEGHLQKLGAGTLVLIADSTYVGTTTIDQGTLQLGNGGTTGAVGKGTTAGAIVNNGTLAFNHSDDLVVDSTISGSGGLRQMGNSTLTLAAGTTQFPGSLTIDQGTLRIGLGSGTAGTIAGAIINHGSLVSTQSGTWALAGGLSGTGSISRVNSNELIYVSGSGLAFTGTIANPGGTIQVVGSGTLGNFAANTLLFQNNLALAGDTSGNPTTTISSGVTLTLGTGAATGSLAGLITNNGTLAINRSDVFTLDAYNGATGVTGDGGIRQAGTGTTILPGGQFNRPLEIAAGKLELRNAAAGTITNNATLVLGTGAAATGAISGTGAVEFAASSTLSGALTYTGNTLLAAGTTATFALPATTTLTTASGAGALLLSTPTSLTFSGTTSYTGNTTLTAGSTLVLQGTTASPAFDLATGATLELNVATGERNYAASTLFSGTGTLRKTGSGGLLWGSATAIFNLSAGALIDIQGGNFYGGSNANENWSGNQSGLRVASGATFHGVEANVRVDALTGAGTIRSGYGDAGYQKFTFGVANGSGTFSGALANTVGFLGHFVKAGSGNQTLTGTNTYTGSTTIADGTLTLGSTTALAPAPVIFSGGIGTNANLGIAAATTFGSAQSISVAATGLSTLRFTDNAVATLNSAITGAGALHLQGSGTAILNVLPANTGGVTAFTGTTLKLGNAAALNSSTLHFNGGRLDLNAQTWTAALDLSATNGGGITNSGTGAAAISATSTVATTGTLLLGSTGGALTFSGNVTPGSNVSVTADGTGRTILSPATPTAFTALTASGAGATLVLPAPASFTNVSQLTAQNGGQIEFGAAATLALSQLTLDGRPLTGDSSGLSNPNSGTTVRLNVSGTINFFGNATSYVLLGGAGNLYLAGTMEGNGNLAKIGTGKVTLDGVSTDWSGGIEVRQGTLAGAQSLFNNRALNVFSGASAELIGGGSVSIVLTSLTGAGNLVVGGLGVLLDFNGTTPTTHSGAISGPGIFTKSGSGEATLSGAFSAGGLTVTQGTLNLTGTLAAALPLRVNAALTDVARLNVAIASLTSGTTFTGNIENNSQLYLTGMTQHLSANSGSITVHGSPSSILFGDYNVLASMTSNSGTLRVLDGANETLASTSLPEPPFTANLAPFANTGTLTVTGLLPDDGFSTRGPATLTIGTGGTGSVFNQNSGALTVGTDGKLSVRTLNVAGGTTQLNGSVQSGSSQTAATLALTAGTLTGSGRLYGRLALSGGTFSPGNSPGTFTAASATFSGGGTFAFELRDATAGGQGTNWDLLSISGSGTTNSLPNGVLTIGATSANKFNILVSTLDFTTGLPGAAANFTPGSNYTFAFVTTNNGITGFDATAFNLNTSGVQNLVPGTWSIAQAGNALTLNFTASAIPEPSTYAAILGVLTLALAAYRRRK